MKKLKFSLWVFLSLIGLMALSSSAIALQYGYFDYSVSNGTVTITKYFGPDGVVVIPASINSMPVVGIGGYTVYLRQGYTYIGAFEVSGVTSVTIPDSVTSIGIRAFSDCTHLTRAYFLGNAPSMGQGVFGGCSNSFSVCYIAEATGFTSPTWIYYNSGGVVSSCPASVCEATLIELSSFTATPKASKDILQWSTESEIDNAGFNLYRSESEDGQFTKINPFLIPAKGSSTQGASYEFIDSGLQNRKTYYYKLEDIDLNGTSTMHGPVSATPRLIFGIRE
jgi:hypothetical protein